MVRISKERCIRCWYCARHFVHIANRDKHVDKYHQDILLFLETQQNPRRDGSFSSGTDALLPDVDGAVEHQELHNTPSNDEATPPATTHRPPNPRHDRSFSSGTDAVLPDVDGAVEHQELHNTPSNDEATPPATTLRPP